MKNVFMTLVNGQPAPWPNDVFKLWQEKTKDWPDEDKAMVERANYFTPRPYVDEYNRGSDKEGFVYTLQPGNRVCYLQWTPQQKSR